VDANIDIDGKHGLEPRSRRGRPTRGFVIVCLALTGAIAFLGGSPTQAGAALRSATTASPVRAITSHTLSREPHKPGVGDYVWVTLPVKFRGVLASATVNIVPSSPANCVGAASNLTFDVHLNSPLSGPQEDVGAQIHRSDACNTEASYQGFSVTMTFLGGGPPDIPAGAKVTFPIWFGQRNAGDHYFMMCGTDPYGFDPDRSYPITGARNNVTCHADAYHTTIRINTF